jgi:hypothetical protein
MTMNTELAGPLEVRSTDVLEPTRAYRHFGGMCWAVPGERMDELAYALTFAPEGHAFTLSERLTIRSFLDCYRELVALPEKTRNQRVREIRKGPGFGGL